VQTLAGEPKGATGGCCWINPIFNNKL